MLPHGNAPDSNHFTIHLGDFRGGDKVTCCPKDIAASVVSSSGIGEDFRHVLGESDWATTELYKQENTVEIFLARSSYV